ncbi:MAG: alpha/beta hydrolase [Bacillota bacterium]
MHKSEKISGWLISANLKPSIRARLFGLVKMGIDLDDYKKMRKKMEAFDRMKIPAGITVKESLIKNAHVQHIIPKAGVREDKVVLCLHGGGFVLGGRAYSRMSGIAIAKSTQCTTVAVDYRLAPEHPFPAALDDALDTYLELIKQGIRPEDIVLYGVSAGGGICLSMCHKLKELGFGLPSAIVALSPPTDFSGSGESRKTMLGKDPLFSKNGLGNVAKLLVGDHDPNDPYLSPAFGDFSGFPPIRIYVGERELLLSDSLMVGERAYAQGVDVEVQVWKGMFHAFPIMGRLLPESRRAMNEISRYIRSRLSAE